MMRDGPMPGSFFSVFSIPEPWIWTLAKHDEITGLCEALDGRQVVAP
jgi:hypothetical protein